MRMRCIPDADAGAKADGGIASCGSIRLTALPRRGAQQLYGMEEDDED